MPWRALTGYQEVSVDNYPKMLVPAVPSSGYLAGLSGVVVLDTTKALHVWNGRTAPPRYIPVADVKPGVLVDEQHIQKLHLGTARWHGLRVGELARACFKALRG